MIEIKRWDSGEVIHSGDFADIKECLEDGVSNGVDFYRAKLNGAELNRAELNGAELNRAELNDAKLPKMSVSICAGEEYCLFISPMVVQAGCQSHHPDEWRSFSKDQVANMDAVKL